MLKRAAAFGLLGLLLIAACSPAAPAATATASPVPDTATPAATTTPAPTVTPFVRLTLPPTWTPEATEAAQAVEVAYTPDPRLATLRANVHLGEICDRFGVDYSRSATTVQLGSPAQVYWLSVPNASVYEVTVYGPNATVVAVQRTSDTTISLRPSLFTGYNQPYGWQVVPLDTSGNYMCIPRGGELRTSAN
jgi:hypothetical protein